MAARRTPGKPVVLVVEDDDSLRETIRLTLLPIGVDVLEASSVEDARHQLSDPVALVVLDFYLEPELGTDLLDDVPPGIPVLLLTASLETQSLIQKHRQISAVMRKPFDARKLRSTVKGLLGIP